MALYYSATRGFLTDSLHADIPDNAVPVSAADHLALLDGQSAGRAIVADRNGAPCLAPVVRPTLAQLRDRATIKIKREAVRRIDAIAPIWRQLNDQRDPSEAGAARFAAIDAIRAASDAIEQAVASASAKALAALDIANHPLWPAD